MWAEPSRSQASFCHALANGKVVVATAALAMNKTSSPTILLGFVGLGPKQGKVESRFCRASVSVVFVQKMYCLAGSHRRRWSAADGC